MHKRVVIFGAGGHAKVIADIVLKSGDEVVGFLDDNIECGRRWQEIEVVGNLMKFRDFLHCQFIIGIGNNHIRRRLVEELPDLDYYTAIHPRAVLANDISIGKGSAVMASAIINTSTKVGEHCIINTGAIIEHDNFIGDFVHISPNTVLSGNVSVGKYTHVGTGASVRNNIRIAENCVIGVGGIVVKNIEKEGIYVGVPVKELIK